MQIIIGICALISYSELYSNLMSFRSDGPLSSVERAAQHSLYCHCPSSSAPKISVHDSNYLWPRSSLLFLYPWLCLDCEMYASCPVQFSYGGSCGWTRCNVRSFTSILALRKIISVCECSTERRCRRCSGSISRGLGPSYRLS